MWGYCSHKEVSGIPQDSQTSWTGEICSRVLVLFSIRPSLGSFPFLPIYIFVGSLGGGGGRRRRKVVKCTGHVCVGNNIGLDEVLSIVKMAKENLYMELWEDRVEEVRSNTLEVNAMGWRVILMGDPENIKAILATQFTAMVCLFPPCFFLEQIRLLTVSALVGEGEGKDKKGKGELFHNQWKSLLEIAYSPQTVRSGRPRASQSAPSLPRAGSRILKRSTNTLAGRLTVSLTEFIRDKQMLRDQILAALLAGRVGYT